MTAPTGRCPDTEPHPRHWHTVRADGITVAGFQCAGIAPPMTAADGRAHTTDGDRELYEQFKTRAEEVAFTIVGADPARWCVAMIASAMLEGVAAERRRAAEDGEGALAAVLALHQPVGAFGDRWCGCCGETWICRTVAAIRRPVAQGAAEDGQRLRERVEALAAEWERECRYSGFSEYTRELSGIHAYALRAALRDDAGDGR